MVKTILIIAIVVILIVSFSCIALTQVANKPKQEQKDYIILTATNMNYGEVNYESDYWSGTDYEFNVNGTLKRTISHNLSGDKVESCIVTGNMLSEILGLIEKTSSIKEGTDACDGDAWSIKYFDEHGNETNHFNGYIYGLDDFEKLTNLFDEAFELFNPIGTCLYANHVFTGTNDKTLKETWIDVKYTLNYDGTMTVITNAGDMAEPETKNITISKNKVDKICELMSQQKDTESKDVVYDGGTWIFQYMNEKGETIKKFHGYIESYDNLLEIQKILSDAFQ